MKSNSHLKTTLTRAGVSNYVPIEMVNYNFRDARWPGLAGRRIGDCLWRQQGQHVEHWKGQARLVQPQIGRKVRSLRYPPGIIREEMLGEPTKLNLPDCGWIFTKQEKLDKPNEQMISLRCVYKFERKTEN